MSGFINYGVSRVLQEIPNEILQRAFGGNEWRDFGGQVSIDERIRREVIYGMVMPDCNIVGGKAPRSMSGTYRNVFYLTAYKLRFP